jgi:hypothetical protein
MADNTADYGFRWKQSRFSSGLPNFEYFPVASAYQAAPGGVNVDLNIGDPVKKVTDGTVALCAAGDATFGIVAAIAPYFDGSRMARSNRLPGGTTYGSNLERQSFVGIILLAGNIFECVCDDNTTATTQAAYTAFIGENVDITINQVSGSTLATPKLDISTHEAGGATKVWRIVGLSKRNNIDYTGNSVPLLVTGNLIQEAPDQTTSV